MTRTSGLLWKTPWRMSQNRKFRQRERLRAVDTVITTLHDSLGAAGETCKALSRAVAENIPESEMLPKNKYTVFARGSEGYRKGVHKVPKFTRISTPREGPRGF
ncbi:mitochondrial 54S ribosomal protein YmL31 [Protomyces lactucae-debilis]|uniref:Mitochondrial 54S ribosomal protein YmL31 n=1 Tax=Protomyces lactucae-debilis TaxID=2754530 RepID=A0A1Y2F7L6_PROLT|nr:mitochondrial 54S ribosomal protein YmL31 [Protomyces lactucae-debilis]ORY79920.1 mitochondrial 54S ribosomal protein YmL31 [Protomyces lactucae-debilis]